MKQQTYLLLLLLTISVGRSYSYGHGVKGSFSNSYSSSSASASSSAFSGSFSSDPLVLENAKNNIKFGSGAISSAAANTDSNGANAKASSGSYAGSGAFSSSGSFSGSETGPHNTGSGFIPVAVSSSGAISGGGSYNSGSGSHNAGAGLIPAVTSGSGSISGGSGFHKVGPGLIPVPNENSGAISGTGSQNAGVTMFPVTTSGLGLISGGSGSGFHKVGPGLIRVPDRNSEAISGSGSYNSGPGVGIIPVATSGSGPISGQEAYNSGSGSGFIKDENISGKLCGGPNHKCSFENNQGSYLGSGSGPKPTTVGQHNGANSYSNTNNNHVRYNGNINGTPNKIFINDLQIPEEFPPIRGLPKHQFPGPEGNINDFKPIGENPQITAQVPNSAVPSGSNANSYTGSNQDSLKPGSCKNCKGPFPGPKGNIYDYKPAPQIGAGPPAWVPEEQTQPSLVRPSPNVFNQFPGSTGSIYDSKPVTAQENIHVAVVGNQNKPTYNQEVQTKPGSIAVSVIGKLPGPTGNIHDSVNKIHPKENKPTTYEQNPIPSPDLIHTFPGRPGNIYDSKPASGCSNGQCNIETIHPNNKPNQPDCTKGQCDEYGGRLGCHGDDCFGPGKKPFYTQTGSQNKADSNHENGNANIDFNHPTPGSNKPDCSKGQCNVDGTYYPKNPISGIPGRVCSGSQCLVVPQRDQVNINLSDDKYLKHPELDFNIDIRQKPDNLDYQQPMCFGSYCKQVPQVDKVNKPKQPEHGYVGSNSNSNADAHNSRNEGKIDLQIEQKNNSIPNEIPLEADFPKDVSTSTTKRPGSMDFLLPGNKPYHHHVVKLHPKPEHEPKPQQTSDTYYQCTGESCPLPKPNIPQPTPNKNCEGNNCRQGPYYTCSGSSCPLPKPIPNCQGGLCGVPERRPGCQGSQCGAGGKDRLFPSSFVAPVNTNGPSGPVIIDVIPQRNPENNKFQGQYAGSASNAEANSFKEVLNGDIALPGTGHLPVEYPSQNLYRGNSDDREKQGLNVGCSKGTCQLIPANLDLNSQGYVAGNVVVQKSNGAEVPVIEVVVPNIHPQQQESSGEYSGSFSGSSGVRPCAKSNCQQGHSGSYSGHKSDGELCGNGNCGNGINAAQSGSFSGVKGGCKNGNCGQIPVGGSSYSGSSAFSGSASFDGGHLGQESTFKTLKDLLTQKIKETGFDDGIPGSFGGGAGSFSHSGAASSSFGSSSAYSGAYSSAGSTSY